MAQTDIGGLVFSKVAEVVELLTTDVIPQIQGYGQRRQRLQSAQPSVDPAVRIVGT